MTVHRYHLEAQDLHHDEAEDGTSALDAAHAHRARAIEAQEATIALQAKTIAAHNVAIEKQIKQLDAARAARPKGELEKAQDAIDADPPAWKVQNVVRVAAPPSPGAPAPVRPRQSALDRAQEALDAAPDPWTRCNYGALEKW